MSTNLATKIKFFLSGGLNNSSPNKSLGGVSSSFPVTGSMNSLFSDITSEEAQVGKIDFRCFYIKNLSETESLFDSKIFILSQKSTGSTAQIGISKATDTQEIRINGSVVSGNLVLRYMQSQFAVSWGGSAATFSSNLSSAFSSNGLGGVEISHVGSSLSNVFTLKFKGNLNYRNNATFELLSNNLVSISKPVVTVKKLIEGRPINSLAPLLAVETVPPSNVDFYNSSLAEKIELGTIKPGDFIPIWIKRFTGANTEFDEKDYFVFKITGSPFN